MRHVPILLVSAFPLLHLTAPSSLAEEKPVAPTAEQMEFFEKNVRPVLANHCYACHSHEQGKTKGGLALDSQAGWAKGGDSGPAILPGKPDQSLLIQAVRYEQDDLKMPPPKDDVEQLDEEVIAKLEQWVRMGAPDPRSAPPLSTLNPQPSTPQNHWSFQPVRDPAVPSIPSFPAAWVFNPVDAFILEKLATRGLQPSPTADRASLIRRATYDLTGLPPTPEEVEAFLRDPAPDAFAKVVNRLLDSPHYGERWGRHWLDVARYADTTGERAVRNSETRYPYAYTYRDWVVRAFNEDLPYDRFLLQQLAADQLDTAQDPRTLAALGFLTVGKRFLNANDDVIDDRIDVVTRGLQGLSVTCARCHDHKFDPIPTEDYYSLHGVFASCEEPSRGPLLSDPDDSNDYREFQKMLAQREEALDEFRAKAYGKVESKVRERTGDYLLAVYEFTEKKSKLSANNFYRSRDLDANVARNWERELKQRRKARDPIFAPFFALAALPENNRKFATAAARLIESFNSQETASQTVHPLVAQRLTEAAPQSMQEVAECYGRLFADVDREWQSAREEHRRGRPGQAEAENGEPSRLTSLPDADREAIRLVLYAENSPARLDQRSLQRLVGQKVQREENELQRKINDLIFEHPGSPARAMVLNDVARPRDSFVYVRGDRAHRGPVVPRRYLEVLEGDSRQPFSHGSGRLDLARAIVDPDNPLTARVMVNRIWHWHFGQGLVATPSDFGLRGEPPTHPELLDWLARRFMENGWSIKETHRLIMLSRTYQQSSADQPAFADIDPGNALLWRMNRRRLDFEALRDTLIAVTGKLDDTLGGRPVDLTGPSVSLRRTLYGFVDRLDLPDMFLTFDFANPEMSSPQRYETTVPQQALFMMNSPFVVERARDLVRRPDVQALTDDRSRMARLHQILYQRPADAQDIELGLAFLERQKEGETAVPSLPDAAAEGRPKAKGKAKGKSKPTAKSVAAAKELGAWERYAQVLLLANELVYVN